MFYVQDKDLCTIAARLVEIVGQRYYDTMSPKEQSELQAAFAQKIRETLESLELEQKEWEEATAQ